jgi:hypothetical protein
MERKQDFEVQQWIMREREQMEWLTLPPQEGRTVIYSPRGNLDAWRNFATQPRGKNGGHTGLI